jgi:hypothetical protein
MDDIMIVAEKIGLNKQQTLSIIEKIYFYAQKTSRKI